MNLINLRGGGSTERTPPGYSLLTLQFFDHLGTNCSSGQGHAPLPLLFPKLIVGTVKATSHSYLRGCRSTASMVSLQTYTAASYVLV